MAVSAMTAKIYSNKKSEKLFQNCNGRRLIDADGCVTCTVHPPGDATPYDCHLTIVETTGTREQDCNTTANTPTTCE